MKNIILLLALSSAVKGFAKTPEVDPRCDSKFQQKLSILSNLHAGHGSALSLGMLALVNPNEMRKLKIQAELAGPNKPLKVLADVTEFINQANEKIEADTKRAFEILKESKAPSEGTLKKIQAQFKKEGIQYGVELVNGKLALTGWDSYKNHLEKTVYKKYPSLKNIEVVEPYPPDQMLRAAGDILRSKAYTASFASRGIDVGSTEIVDPRTKELNKEFARARKMWFKGARSQSSNFANYVAKEKDITARLLKRTAVAGAAGLGAAAVVAQEMPALAQEKKASDLLIRCGVSPARAQELATSLQSSSKPGYFESVKCQDLKLDVDEVLANPSGVSETGFTYEKAECELLQQQMSELEKEYFKKSNLDFVSCGTPASVSNESGEKIGQFVQSAQGTTVFESTVKENAFGVRLQVDNFKSGLDFNAIDMECFQTIGEKKIERPSCSSHLRTSIAVTTSNLSAVPVPELSKDRFYSSASEIAKAQNSKMSAPLKHLSENKAALQKALSEFTLNCPGRTKASASSTNPGSSSPASTSKVNTDQ